MQRPLFTITKFLLHHYTLSVEFFCSLGGTCSGVFGKQNRRTPTESGTLMEVRHDCMRQLTETGSEIKKRYSPCSVCIK